MKKNPSQNLMRQYGALIALIILVVINCFTTKNFISVMTLWNLFTQATTVMILGLGMTIVIATGGINISVGSVLALSSMVWQIYSEWAYCHGRDCIFGCGRINRSSHWHYSYQI